MNVDIRSASVAILVLLASPPANAQQVYPCETAELVDADGAANDVFSLSIENEHALIGGSTLPSGSGAAYLFIRAGQEWSQAAKLVPADGPQNQFANVVLLAEGDAFAGFANGVYVYSQSVFGWVQQQKLEVSSPSFGGTIALDRNASTLVACDDSGNIAVFESVGGLWQESSSFLVPNGRCVAVEGGMLLVGAPLEDTSGPDDGAVFAFENQGGTWVQVQKLLASPAQMQARFGSSVSISGGTAFIGEPFRNFLSGSEGTVHVFDNAGVWTPIQMLVPTFQVGGDKFGLHLDADGQTLVVSATLTADAHVFSLQGGFWIHDAVPDISPLSNNNDVVSISDRVVLMPKDLGPTKIGVVIDLKDGLYGCPKTVSVAPGGNQQFEVIVDPIHAGELYLLLGTMSGVSPGFTLPPFGVPLNLDAYFSFTLANVNNPPPLENTFAPVNPDGTGHPLFALPPALTPGLAGLTAHHAFALLDPATFQLQLVSNPVQLSFDP